MHVWLIDDSETDILYEQIVIERAQPGVTVRAFESALDALAELRRGAAAKPDAILLDINMPRMNGFEFLDAYETMPANLRAGIHLLMVSSSPLEEDRQRARSYASVRGYLTKPVGPEQMAAALPRPGAGS